MLKELKIQNFAIIENSELVFTPGMTVLTGETGAGKTIIIDAISLLLGTRANLEMIRHGQTKAIIEGIFDAPSGRLVEVLATYDIPQEHELTITRVVQEARSTIRINGVSVTAKELREVSLYLLDIHVQHDTMRLFDPARYLELLDDYAATDGATYTALRAPYVAAVHQYNEFVRLEADAKEQLDYWQFQHQELAELAVQIGEQAALEEERASLKNYDKIYELLQRITTTDAVPLMADILASLQKLEQWEVAKEERERAEAAYYEWIDVIDSIQTRRHALSYDPDRLDRIETRLQELTRVARKYKVSADELIDKQQELWSKIQTFEDAGLTKQSLLQAVEAAYTPLLAAAHQMSAHRTDAAATLETKLQEEVQSLQLPDVQFALVVQQTAPASMLDDAAFLAHGIDHVDILISTNKGEPLKPLARVASGGEISRVMLGLKAVLLERSGLSTIIFDEIDQGVSGAVAQAMAEKLHHLSTTTQVLLITHLAQVAAIADAHLLVKKQEVDGRTLSTAVRLAKAERIQAIAEMISPEAVSEKSLALAKEYIDRYS